MNYCLPAVVHHWVTALPNTKLPPHNIYFVLNYPTATMYITDSDGLAYLVGSEGGGGGDITLTSPNGTISINGYGIDVSNEVLDSIIVLHNNFPDLQGGTWHLTLTEHDYLLNLISDNTIGKLTNAVNLLATPPTYVAPTSSISNVAGTFEVGATTAINITQTFTQNDGGALVSQSITKNGTVVSNTDAFTESLPITLGNVTYTGSVNYSEGDCKDNNIGIEDCTNKILAGTTTSPNRVVTGALRRYAGSVATLPTTGAEIRTALLGNSVLNTANTFSFSTGTTNRRFVIAIPAAKTLSTVQNTGTNEFLIFNLNGSITTTPDAAGNPQTYKVYTLENAVPFTTNYTLNVTLI